MEEKNKRLTMNNRELHDRSYGNLDNLQDIEDRAKLEEELNQTRQKLKKYENLIRDKKEFQQLDELV